MDAAVEPDTSEQGDKELRLHERQFQLLVEGVTDYAIYLIDPEGKVSSWNAGAQRIKGYMPSEIIGHHFSRFYTEEDRASNEPGKALSAAASVGRFEKEGWRVRKDGSRFMAHVVIDAIRGDNGELMGFAKITRDITEKRQAERTLERAREALFQSQKMDAIGQLTGGIAHDFNNLLMAIIGSIEMVRKRLPEDPRIVPLLDNAILGARRGTALTQRMLAFARRQDLKTEAVDVPVLLRGMTELLQRSLGPHVSVETRFPLVLARALGDVNQLELALLNLALNARDAMTEGGRIVIAAREQEISHEDSALPSGRYVCIAVTDTGEGMDEATLARATEPFFTTKGVGKGTGLGLAMVHGTALQLGGSLTLKSRKGEGTTAEILLPVAEDAAIAAAPPVEQHSAIGRSLKVLAVDDDALVLMNTTAMLEELGHSVWEAYSGQEALEILGREPTIEVIVTDQAMPQLTGVQLAELAKRDFPHIAIILATGYAELPSGPNLGLVKLAKPFGEHDLARALAEVLDPSRAKART